MKRLLLLLFVIAIKMAVVAQTTFLPMVVEGRTWNVVSIHPADPPKTDSEPGYYKDIKGRWGTGSPHTFELKGDTVLGGVTYKKLFLDGKFLSGLREEDGRIYEWGDPEGLVFDFSLQSGDIFKDAIDELDRENKYKPPMGPGGNVPPVSNPPHKEIHPNILCGSGDDDEENKEEI